jgi:hypothetical protein
MILVVDRAREGVVALLMPSHMRIICKQSALDLLHELYVSTLTLFAHMTWWTWAVLLIEIILGKGLAPNDAVKVIWLCFPTPIDCITQPNHMYIQSDWAPSYAVDGCRKYRVGLNPNDVEMSCMRLQTPVHCIPHPFCMYTKCLSTQSPVYCIPHPFHIYTKWFSTLICCGWAYISRLHCWTWHCA